MTFSHHHSGRFAGFLRPCTFRFQVFTNSLHVPWAPALHGGSWLLSCGFAFSRFVSLLACVFHFWCRLLIRAPSKRKFWAALSSPFRTCTMFDLLFNTSKLAEEGRNKKSPATAISLALQYPYVALAFLRTSVFRESTHPHKWFITLVTLVHSSLLPHAFHLLTTL